MIGIIKFFIKKILIPVAAMAVLVSSLASCSLFSGDPNDRNVVYEIAEDKKSVTFFATADARAFSRWSFKVESGEVVRSEKNDWKDDGLFRVTDSRTLTGISEGTSYVAFYVPSSDQQFTIIFGYHITVDSLGQISVEVAESDSQLGQEAQE